MRVVVEALHLLDRQRPRSDQAHLAAEDVPQLRELVEAVPPEEFPERGDARVVGDLEHGPPHLVAVGEARLLLLGAGLHGPELQHQERPAVEPGADLAVERRPGGGQADRQGDQQVERRQRDEQDRGEHVVEDLLDEEVPERGGLGAVVEHRLAAKLVHGHLGRGQGGEAGAHEDLDPLVGAGEQDLRGLVAVEAGEVEDDDIDGLRVEQLDKGRERLGGRVEVAAVDQRVALEARERAAQLLVLGREPDPHGPAAQLFLGEVVGEEPLGQFAAEVDQQAPDGADQDDDRARQLEAQNEEPEDQGDYREAAAAQDGEERVLPLRGPRRLI